MSQPRRLATLLAAVTIGCSLLGGVPARAEPYGVAVPGRFVGDLRKLPVPRKWADEDASEGPERRITHPEALLSVPVPQTQDDPLLGLQTKALQRRSVRVYSPPELNFDAQSFSNVYPPDTVGDVGANYYVQMINHSSGARVTIYDKTTGTVAAGPFWLDSLWTAGGNCAIGSGDPIVLYDQFAGRWLLSEFARFGNHLCIYVSVNNDPITGGWLNYEIETPDFPDYPKYAVWPDAYYITTNESSVAVYAIDRARVLAGLTAPVQRFTATSLGGFGFQALTPADADGTAEPPPGSNAFFVRHNDDEVHLPAVPGSDRLEVWELHLDNNVPANSTFALAGSIGVAEFNSDLCGATSDECIPQPGTSQQLDAVREVVMWRAQYRNFGTHQAIVGNFVTNVAASGVHAGIRWFELRRSGLGAWSLFQEGTFAPDSRQRWLGSIAADRAGNLALGFTTSSLSDYPGIRYTGRLATDAAGVMTQTEINAVSGTDYHVSNRWGDYASMNVDPVNDCTFWFTDEYSTPLDWQTRITRLRYDPPLCTDAPAPVCGNGVKEVGEDCDGVDSTQCAGLCNGGCTCPAPTCGNGVVEVGEYCDGPSPGDCSNGCTAECTCQLCGSVPEPEANCFQQTLPGRSTILIRNKANDAMDRVTWRWAKGDATSIADFGNPTAPTGSQYQLCVYDASGNAQPLFDAKVPPDGTCGTAPCWKGTSKGYKYKDSAAAADGISGVLLKAGDTGKSVVKVAGKGSALAPPTPPFTLPLTVQLVAHNGLATECWQTTYGSFSLNAGETFKAKGP